MDTRYLREFLMLAETQNFWEASERLFMNESTLSKHIKKLETELSVSLFERNTRKVMLTTYGESLIPYARTIIESEQHFRNDLAQKIQMESGTLLLGVIPSMVQYHITDILVGFKKKYPEKNVQLLEGDTTDLLEELLQRKCSLAFLRDSYLHPINSEIIEKIPYTKDQLGIIFPAGHPKAARTDISLKELSEEEFVVLNHGTLLHQLFLSLCHDSKFKPQITFECKRMDSIFDLVSKNMGISLLTDKHFNMSVKNKNAIRKDLVFVPLTPQVYSQTYLCYLKNASLNETAYKMIQFMREYIDSSETESS